MKKFLLAMTAVAAMTGSAFAADLGARPYVKAPAPTPVANWTGFYAFGGAGGGLWASDQHVVDTTSGAPVTLDQRQGGSGWFGTVGLGYDLQFSSAWVAGLFADGQFGSISGSLVDPDFNISGRTKLQDSWAVGARLGYLVAPNVLSYVNGGYTGSRWSGTSFYDLVGDPVGVHTNAVNRDGWFVGGGVENNLDIFGISAPGWFMKTEYRSSFYNRKTVDELFDGTTISTGNSIKADAWTQTVSTSLVYRFNWTGPLVAKY